MRKIQDNIIFDDVKTNGVSTDQWPFILTGQTGPDGDGGIINAVDIYWNGGHLKSSYIGTTGEMLSATTNMIKESEFVDILYKYLHTNVDRNIKVEKTEDNKVYLHI